MIRKILKFALFALAALLVAAGVLYAFGARIILDGGGGVHVGFVKSADEQAEEIASPPRSPARANARARDAGRRA